MNSVASGTQVLDRAVALIDAVARAGACTLAELVEATGLPRPTAHRLATALEQHGVLARDAGGRFVLGGRIAVWGARAGPGLAAAARPVLEDLAAATGESAQLYARDGDRRVCVAVHERPSGLRDTVPLGAVMPLERGSGGTVLLAWAADAERFPVDGAQLAAVRRRGWAQSVGEREPGVASVSAPVRGHDGAVIAAISVSGPIERLGAQPGRRLARAVVAAAETLAAVIAG
ncbi:MAG TPA: IclR family transcriptional regulator [Acidimicrobiia bacterium]|nr:IclR family transcriptional regulator [Acidimicrobiia bacterium]